MGRRSVASGPMAGLACDAKRWSRGDVVVVRNVANSDGSVTGAPMEGDFSTPVLTVVGAETIATISRRFRDDFAKLARALADNRV